TELVDRLALSREERNNNCRDETDRPRKDRRPEVLRHFARVRMCNRSEPAPFDPRDRMERKGEPMMCRSRGRTEQEPIECRVTGRPAPEHAQEKGGEKRCIHKCEYQLKHIHDVVKLCGEVCCSDARGDPHHCGHATDM